MTIEITPELRIAVAAEMKKIAEAAEKREKDEFKAAKAVGTRSVVVSDELDVHGRPLAIGTVQVKRGRKAEPSFAIDEELVLPWVVERFGSDAVRMVLTEQYRTTVKAIARIALREGDPLPPGVTEVPVADPEPVVSWTKATVDGRQVPAAAMLTAMLRRHGVGVGAALGVEAAE